MKITLIEPFFSGSHRAWAEGFARHSSHDVEILRLSGAYWKWRMHGGAVTLARRFLDRHAPPDLLLVSDMLDRICRFLAAPTSFEPTVTRGRAEQFDWRHIAPRYDHALRLAATRDHRPSE